MVDFVPKNFVPSLELLIAKNAVGPGISISLMLKRRAGGSYSEIGITEH